MHSIIKWCSFCLKLALACTAGFILGRFSAPQAPESTTVASANPEKSALDSFRTERQQLRQMQLSQLNEIIHSNTSEAEIITLAKQRQLELMGWAEHEMTLEGILSMRGFDNAIVTVHTDSVNVIVQADAVSRQEAAVILELVMRETGISGGNVKIMPIN